MQPFDGEETETQYLNRLQALSGVAMRHFTRWETYVVDRNEREEEDISEAALDLAQAVVDRATEASDAYIYALEEARDDGDARPESARTKWLYKKGFKGTNMRQ